MAIEDDMLKTLQRIENLLKKSTSSADAPSVAGGRSSILNRVMGSKEGSQDKKTYKATAACVLDLGDAADNVSRKFNRLGKALDLTTDRFTEMNRSSQVFARPSTVRPTAAASLGGATAVGGQSSTAAVNPISAAFGGRAGAEIQNQLGSLGKALSLTKIGVVSLLTELAGVIKPLATDFFLLQGRGISASDSMGGLYIDAAKAGASLQEYTAILSAAGPAAMRSANFDAFGKQLSQTSDQLAGLGVFGQTATELSATLANSSTVLGIPQQQLGDAISKQIGVFGELRKSSMITGDQFKALTAELANSQEVQSQLLGLAGPQRAAAFEELQRTRSIGLQMGATAEASKALGDALIAQRKLTTAQRFQSAGTIRQAGAITGLSASDTETLAALATKKNRTADENTQFAEIGGRLQAQLEEMQNSQNVNQVYIAEQLQERLNSAGVGQQLQSAGNATLTKQSGPVINADVGKNTAETAQFAGQMLTLLQGIAKNPVAGAIISAVSGVAFAASIGFAVQKAITPILTSLLGPSSEFLKLANATKAAQAVGNAEGVTKALIDASKSVEGVAKTVGDSTKVVSDVVKGGQSSKWSTSLGADGSGGAARAASSEAEIIGKTAADTSKAFAEGGKAVAEGGGMLVRSLKFMSKAFAPAASIIDGLIEAFTGELAMAFNPSGGALAKIEGVVTAALWAIPQFILDAMTFVFGDTLMKPVQTLFDIIKVGFVGAINGLLLGLISGASFFTEMLLPKDSGLAKMIKGAKASLEKTLDENATTITTLGDSLGSASSTTLKDISAQNAKDAAEAEKKSKEAAAKVSVANRGFNNVLTDSYGLSADAITTAATIATPGTTERSSVTPPAVNTPSETNQADQDAKSAAASSTKAPTLLDTLTSQFATIIQLLQANLDAEVGQRSAVEAMAYTMGRPWSADQPLMLDRSTRTS